MAQILFPEVNHMIQEDFHNITRPKRAGPFTCCDKLNVWSPGARENQHMSPESGIVMGSTMALMQFFPFLPHMFV